jgi:pSer/pThr/pTyr-binding forkhead associated (FHA) protein
MTDPRLNSVHLDLGRREDFRKARSELLQGCGEKTHQALEAPKPADVAPSSPTALQNLEGRLPHGVDFVLMDQEVVYPLRVGINTVGRMPDNHVVVEDPYVSRRHCAVLIHVGDGGELHDVASKNGTYLNGRRIDHPVVLHTGDEIRMCDRRLIFVAKCSPPPTSAPSPLKTQTDAL